MNDDAQRIAALNDAFRTNLLDRSRGRTYVTDGVVARGTTFVQRAIAAVMTIDCFTADNDPWNEHDFGSIAIDGERIFFKIDYYDKRDPDLGAEDPGDPDTTERVLTIMLADEW